MAAVRFLSGGGSQPLGEGGGLCPQSREKSFDILIGKLREKNKR